MFKTNCDVTNRNWGAQKTWVHWPRMTFMVKGPD